MRRIEVKLNGPHCDDIRRMTGEPDQEWLKMAIACYWTLLSHNADNVVRMVLDDGSTAVLGLTPQSAILLAERQAEINKLEPKE